MTQSIHKAVMTAEAMEFMRPHPGGVYIDATLGGGTHSMELLERSSPDGRVLSFDVDPVALERAAERFSRFGKRWMGVEANFRDLAEVVQSRGFSSVDGVLIDLGLSSDELLDPSKGLSFQVAGPLDMRLGPKANEDGTTAAEIVNTWKPDELVRIVRDYGEERMARRIVDAIVAARKIRPLVSTLDLAEVVRAAVPKSYEKGRIHPATRTFQALRIAVNDELDTLKAALEGARSILAPNGVIVVISFHSLEDRIVKQTFRSAEGLNILTKKPLIATEEEARSNPRARSAKLRAAEKNQSPTKNTNKYKKYDTRVRPQHE